MKMRVGRTIGFVSILALVVGAVYLLRLRSDGVTLGPHKGNIRWVSYREAHSKPWINLFGGKLMYPKPPTCRFLGDERFIAGYLVSEAKGTSWAGTALGAAEDLRNNFSFAYLSPDTTGHTFEIRPVPFPSTPALAKQIMTVGGDEVSITVPYQSERLAARYQPESILVDGYQITAWICLLYDVGDPRVALKIIPQDPDEKIFANDFDSRAKNYSLVEEFDHERWHPAYVRSECLGSAATVEVFGEMGRHEEVVVEARIVHFINGRWVKSNPFTITLTPRPAR